jgi:hypothetical protein
MISRVSASLAGSPASLPFFASRQVFCSAVRSAKSSMDSSVRQPTRRCSPMRPAIGLEPFNPSRCQGITVGASSGASSPRPWRGLWSLKWRVVVEDCLGVATAERQGAIGALRSYRAYEAFCVSWRACWVAQAAAGWAVTPRMWARRLRTSMTNGAYRRCAARPSHCAVRGVRHPRHGPLTPPGVTHSVRLQLGTDVRIYDLPPGVRSAARTECAMRKGLSKRR